MALAAYSDLTALVQLQLNRDDADTVGQIPNFIRYAHDEIVRTLRLPAVTTVVPGFQIDGERVALPADFQSLQALVITDVPGGDVKITSPALRQAKAVELVTNGQPRWAAVENANIAFAPVPDATYTATLIYDAVPLLMSAPTDTNAIFSKTPWLYVHGALAAGFRFNQFTEAATEHETLFRGMLTDIATKGVKDATAGRLEPNPSMGFAP